MRAVSVSAPLPPVPPPGPHGGDGPQLAAALGLDPRTTLDLSLSVNPLAPALGPLAAGALAHLGHYPDDRRATALLAEAIGHPAESLLLTNGGAEAISLVVAALGPVAVHPPEFGLWAAAGASLVEGPVEREGDGDGEASEPPRVGASAGLGAAPGASPKWMRRARSNPHSPSGRLAATGARADIWDEAFYPLATGQWTRGDASAAERPAVVVGSLTKLFACPGLRLGYVLAPSPETRQALARRQPAWAVSSLALALVPRLLERADLPAWRDGIATLRKELVGLLVAQGLEVDAADAPWVLVRGLPALRDSLARRGVFVRDCSNFGLVGTLRLAVPGPAGLERLEAVLAEAVADARRPAIVGRGGSSAGGASGGGSSAAGPAIGRDGRPARRADRQAGAGSAHGALFVVGTASDVGKSHLVSGICRWLARSGSRVAPFKAQNMALNSFVTADGGEIGRAQAAQAAAAGVAPEVDMNPILLKPTGERTSQVVVLGRPVAHLDAASYQDAKPALFDTVLASLERLRRRFDVVVCEGAGSPAELNLAATDLVNLRLASAAGIPAILVGDIDRGGVFGAILGTLALLPSDQRALVRGFVVNKLRGDPSLLGPGVEELERRSGLPCLGVVPWIEDVALDAEDSLALGGPRPRAVGPALGDELDVAVVRLPRLSNFTDLDALALEPGVSVRYVERAGELGDPDLVVLPGTKATVADLAWVRARGFERALRAALSRRSTLLGICGGYQMLGEVIEDGVESPEPEVAGLALLPTRTRFSPEKVVRQRRGVVDGIAVEGYEIHHGVVSVALRGGVPGLAAASDGAGPARPDGSPAWSGGAGSARRTRREAGGAGGLQPWLRLTDGFGDEEEGVADAGRGIFATSLHGLFEGDEVRASFLAEVAARRGKRFVPAGVSFRAAREAQLDRLADAVQSYLDTTALLAAIDEARPVEPSSSLGPASSVEPPTPLEPASSVEPPTPLEPASSVEPPTPRPGGRP